MNVVSLSGGVQTHGAHRRLDALFFWLMHARPTNATDATNNARPASTPTNRAKTFPDY